jgi:nucleoside-diphosphate-sugar epimerase
MKTVLLTGASGVVGRALASELRNRRVIGLVHGDCDVPEVDEVVRCDLSAPQLGLRAEEWQRLAAEADEIVHSGALTVWGQPDERYRAINVEGTRRVIELARRAQAPIYYMSTCFVHAIERGGLERLAPENVVKPYIRSKLEAEQLIVDGGVEYSIFRPTNLLGNSLTGASLRPQIVQALSDWILRDKAPYFPIHDGNLIDAVPLDLLTVAVARALEMGHLEKLVWVTSGPAALSAEESLDVLMAHAQELGRSLTRAPIVDPRGPLPVPLVQIPKTSRIFVKVLLDVSEVTHWCGGVLPSSRAELRARYDTTDVPDAEAYCRTLRYWSQDRDESRQLVKEAR